MKVAILYSHLKELGGAENVILKQVELLHHSGYDTTCYFAYVEKKFAKSSSNPHCFVESYFKNPMPSNPVLRILSSIPLAPLTLNALKDSDVLLCHGYGPGPWIGYVLKRIRGLPYLSYIHSPPRFLYLAPEERKLWRFDDTRDIIYSLSKLSRPLLERIDMIGVSNSNQVLVNSHFTAKRVQRIYGVQPTVCYPPVDTEIFKPLETRLIQKVRSKFGFPLILSTGRIAAVKRWEWLIQTMVYVSKSFPSATLAVTGEISKENYNYVQKLLSLAKRLGVDQNVQFLGFRPLNELVKLYNAADVYAYPVPHEDFGLGPAEAIACGTPAVVWNDGSGPCETVINGKTGFRAVPYLIEDFAEKIMKAIEIDKEEIVAFAHTFVEENFSCKKHLESLEKALKLL